MIPQDRNALRRFIEAGLCRLTNAQQKMVGALVSADDAMTYDQLASAMGYRGTNPVNIVTVQMHHIRKRAPSLPIQVVRNFGARWVA